MTATPRSDIELYSTDALLDPYPHYKKLRDLRPAVWLNAYNMFVLTRYDEVKSALSNWQVFSSAGGVTMNDDMNEKLRGGLLCSDPPRHDVLRKIIEKTRFAKCLG
jgi:cytochrome P450